MSTLVLLELSKTPAEMTNAEKDQVKFVAGHSKRKEHAAMEWSAIAEYVMDVPYLASAI